jgi:LysM repeat protein/muramidase (phage lysozyme)
MSGISLNTQNSLSNLSSADASNQGLGQAYTVQNGDTLSDIATAHGTTVDALMAQNPQIRNADTIYPGDQIQIKTGAGYVVQAGDTLGDIAARNNVTVDALLSANPQVSNPDMIYAGDVLKLPSSSSNSGTPSPGSPSATTPAPANPAPSTPAPSAPAPSTPAPSASGNTGTGGSPAPAAGAVAGAPAIPSTPKLDELRRLAADPKVAALLDTIATAEGTKGLGLDGYNVVVHGRVNDSPQYPELNGRVGSPSDPTLLPSLKFFPDVLSGNSSAVGRYQNIAGVEGQGLGWYVAKAHELGLPEVQVPGGADKWIGGERSPVFTPEAQDIVTVQVLKESGAIERLNAGDIDGAIRAAASGGGWASMKVIDPNQPTLPHHALRAIYDKALTNTQAQPGVPYQRVQTAGSSSGSAPTNPAQTSSFPVPKAIADGGYLNKGATGADVTNLQKLLIANGATIKATGGFDNATAAAVEKFKSDPKHPLGTAPGQPQSAVGKTTWDNLVKFAQAQVPAPGPGANNGGPDSGKQLANYYQNNIGKIAKEMDRVVNDIAGGGTGCASMVSSALRMSGQVDIPLKDYPKDGGNTWYHTDGLSRFLESEKGWQRSTNLDDLRPGDIVFTVPGPSTGTAPSHTFVFLGWADKGNHVANIADNQIQEYGAYMHQRPLDGSAPGMSSKDPAAYFLRQPTSASAPGVGNTGNTGNTGKPAAGNSTGQIANVPVFKQGNAVSEVVNDRGCGTTSVAMALSWATGKTVSSDQVYNAVGSADVSGARSYAINNYPVTITDRGNLRSSGGFAGPNTQAEAYKVLTDAIGKGHPVIFSASGPDFSPSGRGHIMLATGVSVKDGVNMFTFNDPGTGTTRTLPFSALWNATDYPQGGSFMWEVARN